MNINAVWKSWYVYRPHQLARRVRSSMAAAQRGHRLVPVSWGVELWADPTEHVGRSISTTGVFDLAVSVATAFEAPSYLATTEARAAIDACTPRGWLTLQRQAHRTQQDAPR